MWDVVLCYHPLSQFTRLGIQVPSDYVTCFGCGYVYEYLSEYFNLASIVFMKEYYTLGI